MDAFPLRWQYVALLGISALFVPCAVCKLYVLTRHPVHHVKGRPRRVTKAALDPLAAGKLVAGSVFICAAIATLAVYSTVEYKPHKKLAWATYAMQVLSAVLALPLSYAQHTRAIAPSTLLTLFLFLGALLDAFYLPGCASYQTALLAPYGVYTGSRVALLALELVHKRRLLDPDACPPATEATASLPARLAFAWLLPLLVRGRTERLSVDALLAHGVPPGMLDASAGDKLRAAIKEPGGVAMLRATFAAFPRAALAPAPPQLVWIAATFGQTYLVQGMLDFVGSYRGDATAEPVSRGWALVGGYVGVYLCIAASTGLYWEKVYAFTVEYRAALVATIFDKTLRLSASAARSEGAGAAVSYITVDVERVVEGIAFAHQAWSAIVSIAVAAVILWFEAGYAMIPPLAVMLLFVGATSVLGRTVDRAQMQWMGATDARIKLMTSVMGQMFRVKLAALEDVVLDKLTKLRITEIAMLRQFYRRIISVAALSTATVNMAGVVALGTYAGISGKSIDPTKLFTVLTVVNLVLMPISTVGHVFPLLLASYASLRRISRFLALDEKAAQEPESIGADAKPVDDIVLKDATFAPATAGTPILHNLDVTFTAGALTMIVGPVGSGKSFLLQCLLGESALLAGTRTRPLRRAAYAAQDAFLLPTTIRANIVLNRPFEDAWYQAVLDACCLKPDLARIAGGDMARVSEAHGLSGGQKQRVGLARAVYARSGVVLLDDCFSALDAHTSAAVFRNLFGPDGLLKGRTVILATHDVHHLKDADDIVVLNEGKVVTQGHYDKLSKRGVSVARYLSSPAGPSAPADEPAAAPEHLPSEAQDAQPRPGDGRDDGRTEPLDDDGELSRGWAPYKWFLECGGWPRFATAAISVLGYSVTEVGLQIFLKEWSESGAVDNGPWIGGYAGIACACAVAAFMAFFAYTQQTTPYASMNVHDRMLRAIVAASPSVLQNTSPNRFINRLSADMNVIDFAFPTSVLDCVITLAYVVGSMVLICIAVPFLAITLPFLGCMYWLLQSFYLATSRQLQGLEMSSRAPLISTFQTTFSGLTTLRAFHAEEFAREEALLHLRRSQAPIYYRYAGIRFLRTSLNAMTLLVAVTVAILAVVTRRSASAGFLGVALSQVVGLSTSVSNLLLAWTRVENGVVSVERARQLSLTPAEQDGRDEGNGFDRNAKWVTEGRVRFKDVSLRYRPGLRPALENASFSIDGGKKLAFCGRTGSGKSSTLLALLGGVDRNLLDGQVLIDDTDVAVVPRRVLRSSMSVIFQDPLLLAISLRENLALRFLGTQNIPSDAEMRWALKRVGLADLLERLEKKLDTVVDDELHLSRGECQLLCLARVLLEKRRLVILDEVSSSMDTQTEARLQSVLATDLKGCTIVAVAHRISSIVDFDSVIVLEDGRVVEQGIPAALIRGAAPSRFKELANAQHVNIDGIKS